MVYTLTAIASQIGQFTERKNSEQELINALARAHEARLEAEGLTNRLTALQRITDAALGHFTVDRVLSESLNRIREVLNVDTVAILLLETEGDELVAWAAHGLEEEVELGVRIPVGKGFAGKVVADRKPIIVEDIAKADVFNPLLQQKGIKSLLGVPMLVEGRATGVLHVGTLAFHHFTEDDVRLLELAADRIAMAVENARLYQVEKTARDEAETANQAKDEFLTILSHELRTPLTPIIGWVHMMQNGILPEADFDRVLSVVNRNAYSLKRLINDLLDMSAILSGKMRIEESPVSVGSVLEESLETMRPYAADSKIQLRLRINAEPDTLMVRGDRNRLNQTFCNILHNAIKFSPQNGFVHVTCEAVNTEVVIRFRDQGEGIPIKFVPHVFERFRQADGSRTRAYGGLGLGLSLVKSFVEAHHGTVEAISEGEGKGSTFIVKLPRDTGEDQRRLNEKELGLQSSKAEIRILVVEDQLDTLEMLTLSLQRQGYKVIGCESAAEALQIAGREPLDILISDIGMPTIDGFQLIRDLRQREPHKNIAAIALTGYASKTDVEATLAAGFDLHLSKPIDPIELAQAVERVLATRQDR
jgi:signal transduction histidine kinase/CheY-like chemotaxis protein